MQRRTGEIQDVRRKAPGGLSGLQENPHALFEFAHSRGCGAHDHGNPLGRVTGKRVGETRHAFKAQVNEAVGTGEIKSEIAGHRSRFLHEPVGKRDLPEQSRVHR